MSNDVLAQWGRILGIDRLTLGEDGRLCLEIEEKGTLFIRQFQDDIQIMLARQLPFIEGSYLRRALELCRPEYGHPWQPNTGLSRENELCFSLRLPNEAFTLLELEKGLEHLITLMEEATGD